MSGSKHIEGAYGSVDGPADPARRRILQGSVALALASPFGGILAAEPSDAAKARAASLRKYKPEPELSIGTPGGSSGAIWKKEIFPIFERLYGVKVIHTEGTTAQLIAQIQANPRRPPLDVIWNNDLVHVLGKELGLFAKLDPAVVDTSRIYPQFVDPDGIGCAGALGAIVLSYNTDAFRKGGFQPPTSWYDLWRPEMAGRVGVFDFTYSVTQYWFMNLARLEGSVTNVEPAFRKLEQLKPNVYAFPTSPAQMDDLVAQGAVWINFNHQLRPNLQAAAGAPVKVVTPKEGALSFANYVDVTRNAAHPVAAQLFADFALSSEIQALNGEKATQGPVNMDAKLSAKTAALVPYGQEAVSRLVRLDYKILNEKVDEWLSQWNRRITAK